MSAYFETMWNSMEFIAKLKKCSCSRLAINGGLDPTAFNRSKRRTKYGQEHWISFGSLIHALSGTNMTLVDFAVIYQILYISNTVPAPEHVQKIISDINALLQQHIDNMQQNNLSPNTQALAR